MTAYLDKQRHYGDYAGGTSDPRLVNRLNNLPGEPPTEDQIKTAERIIQMFATSPADAETLREMILPDEYTGKYVIDLPANESEEAA